MYSTKVTDPLTWRDLVLTGARIGAADAVKARLIDSAVDEKKLLPDAIALATKLARMIHMPSTAACACHAMPSYL